MAGVMCGKDVSCCFGGDVRIEQTCADLRMSGGGKGDSNDDGSNKQTQRSERTS